MMEWKEHSFVVCAYGESPYLEECIRSLKGQRVKSRILMATSTPSKFLDNIGKKYGIPLYIREGESSLAGDWNFAYQVAKSKYVTLAHQDDVYGRTYTEEIRRAGASQRKPLLIFSDYCELREGTYTGESRLLKIKSLMLLPLRSRTLQKSAFVRRRILSLGNPICCPAVTYVKENLPEILFTQGFKSNTDWEAWERISKRKGAFVYVKKRAMAHRIHGGSTTTKIIRESKRTSEDLEMFEKFWPSWVAKGIEKIYGNSEKSNDTGESNENTIDNSRI